jgi:hypothetical protein
MHIHMEMSQGNSMYSYLKETKCHFFPFTKSENRRSGQVLYGGLEPVGGGRMWGNGEGG